MLKFHRSRFYPIKKRANRAYKYEAYVGIGANQGNVKANFKKLIRYFMDDNRVQVVQTSLILENPPFGYLDQPNFFNAIAHIRTSLDAFSFLRFLMHTEKRFKRVRSFKNAPRTLDLDIITFSNLEIKSKKLTLPHPKWSERVSVKAPLMQMARV